MKPRPLHNSTKTILYDFFFTVTLHSFMKYHSPPCFPSRNITKNAETHPHPMGDVIIEQPRTTTARHEVNTKRSKQNIQEICLIGKRCLLTLDLKPFRSQVIEKSSIGREFENLALRGKKLLTYTYL